MKQTLKQHWFDLMKENMRLRSDGVWSLNRHPHDLMPAIEAYKDDVISSGKLRECIVKWLSGIDFSLPENRDWEED